MDIKKVKEIASFYTKPMKTHIKNKKTRLKAHYMKIIETDPVKQNSFLFEAYHGVSLTGNVYALFTELMKDDQLKDAGYFWAVTNLNDPMIDIIKKNYPNRKIQFVKYEEKRYFELLATCQYLFNDTSFMPYFIKRKEQVYINTWHGTPLKTLGLDIKNANLSAHKNIQRNFMHSDILLMPNKFTADKLIKANDLDGILKSRVLITGNARVDFSISSKNKMLIEKLDLPQNKKLVLFAPTWKKSLSETTEEDIIDLLEDVNKIQRSLGDNYKVLLKSHYFVYEYFVNHNLEKEVIPNWVDTNELLSIVDMLITDYSSIFFDFLPTKKPIYFYIPDKEEYKEQRGFYLDLNNLPGSLAVTIEELCDNLIMDDRQYELQFKENYNNYLKEFCSCDDGNSRKRAIDAILNRETNDKAEEVSYFSNKKVLLFYCGGFYNNGITVSAINLSQNINYDKYEVVFLDTAKMGYEKVSNIQKVDKRVHFIYNFGEANRSYFNEIRQNLFYRQGIDSKRLNKDKLINHIGYEFDRIVGQLPIDVAIDFGGYNKAFSALFAFSKAPKKAIYLHAIMKEEFDKKIGKKYKHRWNLKIIFSLYKYFDKVVSVSESANEQNQKDLKQYVPNYHEKMIYVNNAINGESILNTIELGKEMNKINKVVNPIDGKPNYIFFESTNIETGMLTIKSFTPPDKEKINFVTVGRLSPEKNHLSLIEAFSKLVEEDNKVHLYIIGNGPMKAILTRKIIEMNITDSITMLGHVESPAVFVEMCDCFILTSNYEGQGLVLLEAMTIGKPVIGTDVPGIRSVLENTNKSLVDNTLDGIYQGMKDFTTGKIIQSDFDYTAYNEDALRDFYYKVCDEKVV